MEGIGMPLAVVESGEDSYEQPLIVDAAHKQCLVLTTNTESISRTFLKNLVQRIFFFNDFRENMSRRPFDNYCPKQLLCGWTWSRGAEDYALQGVSIDRV
jgi:hypothetical protein